MEYGSEGKEMFFGKVLELTCLRWNILSFTVKERAKMSYLGVRDGLKKKKKKM